MYLVIAGGGLMGLTLAQELIDRRHDVLIIDSDPAVCTYVQEELGAMVYCGSATSTKTLEAVGIRRADIAVAMMRNDANNLAFLLLAKSYGVPNRIARMRDTDYVQPYRLAGATSIASSVSPLIDQIVVSIEYPEVKALMRISKGNKGNIDVFEVNVPEDAAVAGRTVGELAQAPGFPSTCNFVAVEATEGNVEIARGTTVVPGGSDVTVLALEEDIAQVIKMLTRRREA